jgi:DHA1 family bicyclomycin/chloramphenicol resistance-like MFS transporter
MGRISTRKLTFLLASFTALGPMATDMYLAALPALTGFFDATVAQTQLTLSVYIAGFGLAHLIYGPLSDRFGRKPILLGGLLVYALAGLGCALAGSITALIVLRFFQAVGGAAGPVIARAVVRDLFDLEGATRALSYVSMVMGVAPAVAPVIGGYLTVWFDWRATFYAVSAYGLLVAMAAIFLLVESLPNRDPHALRLRSMAGVFGQLFRSPAFISNALLCSFCYAGLFAFISGASFVLIGIYGVPVDRFGYCFGFVVMGYMTGAFLSGRIKSESMLGAGVITCCLAGAVMAGLVLAGVDHFMAVVGPMALYMIGTGIVLPRSQAWALMPFPGIAGRASAVLGFLQMTMGALAGALVGHLLGGSALPMAGTIALSALAALGCFFWGRDVRRRALS